VTATRNGNAKLAKPAKKPHLVFLVCVLCGLGVPLLLPTAAFAHPVPFSYVDLRLQPGAIEGTVVAHIFDLAHDLNIVPAERLLDPAVASPQAAAIGRLFTPRLTVTANGVVLTPQWSSAEVVADRQSVKLAVRYAMAGSVGTVGVTAVMFPYDPQHQTFLNIYEGNALTQAILDAGHTRFEYFSGSRQGAVAVIQKFLPRWTKSRILVELVSADHVSDFFLEVSDLRDGVAELALVKR